MSSGSFSEGFLAQRMIAGTMTPITAAAKVWTAKSPGSRPVREAISAQIIACVSTAIWSCLARSAGTEDEPRPDGDLLELGGGELAERRPYGLSEGVDQRSAGRDLAEQADGQRIVLVLYDHVFLGREVTEERARRHLRGLGDLLDGRGR